MKLFLKKEERDYTTSGGLFNSSQIQDVEIFDEKNNRLSWLVVKQSYNHTNSWGTHRIEGGVEIEFAEENFKAYMNEKYDGLTLQVVNKYFRPLSFTTKGEFEEVLI